jgi:chemotaxis protein CheD
MSDASTQPRVINVGQGDWAVAREGRLRTVLGSCVAICLYDPIAGVGGMNHFLYPPLGGRILSRSTLAGDLCMEGLFVAVLCAGGRHDRILAKAFGGGAMFDLESNELTVGERNAAFAKSWLASKRIPLNIADLYGTCAREVVFTPANGHHACRRLPVNFAPGAQAKTGPGRV